MVRLLVAGLLTSGPRVETIALMPLVHGAQIVPAPGLRAVWNDLTPLVSSAMQRCAFDESVSKGNLGTLQ